MLTSADHKYFNDRFNDLAPIHTHNTRFNSIDNYNVPHHQRAVGQRFFVYQCIKIWNELPYDVRNSYTVYTFRKRYKAHTIENHSTYR